ncbi:Vitamin B12 transporter BtuB [Pedobacter sp. Bi27]|uniref:TonB-dependent receptor n=1 Tax=Pedobacter sp. Bi27 TaxID=2822351 RepID=UPI001D830DE4|nr:TonB-dependent receptor [Pedobacter sp. Bi27]CAH0161621.1 Vitamin B12 transporter BtuB [Pedobacter sp. Bi126]CAH0162202.1 Vitamin B12 transporter BtuB [Pedobacter sp. Bi27]CAH0280896.1 Vitamin B12 transporter BtuB [Pedobacter sp. Bi36]
MVKPSIIDLLKPNLTLLLTLFSFTGLAQTIKPDSTKKLEEVTVKGYYNSHSLLRSVSAVTLIDSNLIGNQQSSSLVSTLNTVPGVRMEERSPGSYRLSLRGSLLRSPFGIRNIKIYIDDFPLTDAGGNTYLNALDVSAVGMMEIYKGPEASIFGANTGGAILINPPSINHNEINISAIGGSYGLLHQTASIKQQYKKYSFSFSEGYQRSDGYRQNSAMGRKYFQTLQQWNYSNAGSLKAFVFYSDLNYETPGGLTAAQLDQNPKLARPATPTLPGAISQQAAIYNKTIFGGISNSYQINKYLKHVMALFTSYTDFKNPFITNYEQRYESTLGLRTFLEYAQAKEDIKFNAQIGLESSATKSQIKNFNNNSGEATSMQASDRLKAGQDFAYFRLNFDINNKFLIELASSLNFFSYNYESYFPVTIATKERKFNTQFMPKAALSYLIANDISVRASVSKGYSTPTIAEVRSSDNNINNDLQAESGWNYELGLRYKTGNNRFYANGNIFHYELKNAIVRRLNQNDAEYFINAGGTKQEGIELETALWIIKNNTSWLTGLQLRSNYTWSRFKFEDFVSGTSNYAGNQLTGVPKNIWVNSLEFNFKKELYFFAQHNYTSAIPLNDANTTFSKRYHLLEVKAGIKNLRLSRTRLDLFAGVNNLLDVNYSLGNDLNAANGRYFNPAPGINFYTGLSITL